MKGFGNISTALTPVAIATIAVLAASLMDGFEAIRVYEGTNFGRNSDLGKSDSRSRNPAPESVQGSVLPPPANASRRAIASAQHFKPDGETERSPNLYKVKLTQRGYPQFLRYLADIPPVREFTFCMWFMGSDLSRAQPLFSYGVQGKERILGFWYEPKDSTLRMSVRDDLAFKIPAIIREGKWYQICLSWDGVHGRWVVFLNGSRIGSGQLHKYKGTYIPGGGDVAIGREPTNLHSGHGGGIEGEIFGFNLVDESVKDEAFGHKSRIALDKPPESVPTPYVPPFKALPPIKKSYQEIKAYVKSLPSDPGHFGGHGTRKGPKNGQGYHVRKPGRKKKPHRPGRTKSRPRHKPPVRKAIVYERADRQLRPGGGGIVKKMGEPRGAVRESPQDGGPPGHVYHANYSVHSYRAPKEARREKPWYEIYEVPDEQEEGSPKSERRKPRQDFDLDTARKANSLYAASSRKLSEGKTKFHYETTDGKWKLQRGVRRSVAPEERPPAGGAPERRKAPLDFIPVHETVEEDDPSLRRKRSPDSATATGRKAREVVDLAADFRRLPHIPDGFISLFAGLPTPDRKPGNFLPNGTVATTHPTADAEKLSLRNDVFDGLLPRSPAQVRRTMVVRLADLEGKPGATAGSELVKRSFEECATDRGSPLSDKDRLLISWAHTPVRIYGGAAVAAAESACGRF